MATTGFRGPATLTAQDIEIGAVEVKDATSDIRAAVATDGQLFIAPYAGTVAVVDDVANAVVLPRGRNENALTGEITTPVRPWRFNGVTWDRERNNSEVTVLASASNAAATRTSADQINHNARGIVLILDITALGVGETLAVNIEIKNPVSGIYLTLAGFAAVGVNNSYTIYPGAVETLAQGDHQIDALALPRTWRARVTTSAGLNASTFSLSGSYVL